jgi:hypothetical protein
MSDQEDPAPSKHKRALPIPNGKLLAIGGKEDSWKSKG